MIERPDGQTRTKRRLQRMDQAHPGHGPGGDIVGTDGLEGRRRRPGAGARGQLGRPAAAAIMRGPVVFRRQVIVSDAVRREHRPAVKMPVIGAYRLDHMPERGRVGRRCGKPGIIGSLVMERVGEGKINTHQDRRAIAGRRLGQQTVAHIIAAPVAAVFGKPGVRHALSGPGHGKLDAGLARPPRPGPVDADESGKHAPGQSPEDGAEMRSRRSEAVALNPSASALPSSTASTRFAMTLPSSTPHWSKLFRPQTNPLTAVTCS